MVVDATAAAKLGVDDGVAADDGATVVDCAVGDCGWAPGNNGAAALEDDWLEFATLMFSFCALLAFCCDGFGAATLAAVTLLIAWCFVTNAVIVDAVVTVISVPVVIVAAFRVVLAMLRADTLLAVAAIFSVEFTSAGLSLFSSIPFTKEPSVLVDISAFKCFITGLFFIFGWGIMFDMSGEYVGAAVAATATLFGRRAELAVTSVLLARDGSVRCI